MEEGVSQNPELLIAIRGIQHSKAKLKAASNTSALLAGFAMVSIMLDTEDELLHCILYCNLIFQIIVIC